MMMRPGNLISLHLDSAPGAFSTVFGLMQRAGQNTACLGLVQAGEGPPVPSLKIGDLQLTVEFMRLLTTAFKELAPPDLPFTTLVFVKLRGDVDAGLPMEVPAQLAMGEERFPSVVVNMPEGLHLRVHARGGDHRFDFLLLCPIYGGDYRFDFLS